MTLKSTKSKWIRKHLKHNDKSLSDDGQSFILGGMKILTDYLTKQTKDILVKLYKKKQLNILVKNIHHNNPYNERYVVLTEREAVEMIKHLALSKKRQLLEKQFQSNDIFMSKINQQQIEMNQRQQRVNNYYQKCKTIIYQTFTKLYVQVKQTRQQLNQQLINGQTQLRKFIQEKILYIEKQLFISTILMIIEQYTEQITNEEINYVKPVNCFVVFQQAYPIKSFTIKEIIQIIGEQQYQTKKIHTLKIYDASISNQNFYNPTFVTCHDCMRVVTNMNFPQHNLKCLKVVHGEKQKNINSHFLLTPKRFLDKFINHEFFNFYDDEKEFQHPYVQYHLKTGINKLACGRNWCGPCRIKYKRRMSMTHCDFCDFICQCTRCKRYEKIVQLLGHYMKIGGQINYFDDKFVFNEVFGRRQSLSTSDNKEQTSYNELKEQIFKKHLKLMYESQIKMSDNIKFTTHWQQLKKSSLLSGVFPEQIPLEFPQQIIFHKDQLRRKDSDQMNKIYERERKNYNKYLNEKKEKNLEMTISKLDKSIKSQIIQAHNEQLMMLKRKLQKSQILKTTNPLINQRAIDSTDDVIIISQSSFRKNQLKFHQSVETIEQNPLNRVEQELQYLKMKRQQRKNYLEDYQDEQYESISESSDEKKSEIQSDQNQQNFGSIWE